MLGASHMGRLKGFRKGWNMPDRGAGNELADASRRPMSY